MVSGQSPELYRRGVQPGDGQTQCEGQDRVQNSVESYGSGSVPDSGNAPSDTDLVEEAMSSERATFPPGKRRRSCVAETTLSTAVDKADGGKRDPAFRRMMKSLGYSSSFDLGMTQPGSLAMWRSNSERTRSSVNRRETDQQRVSDSAFYMSGCWSIGDCSGTAVQALSSLVEDDHRVTTDIADNAVCQPEQHVEEPVASRYYHHDHQQQHQQQEVDTSLQQSRQRSDIITSSAWCKSSRSTRRRWSEMIVLPDTPPCSPSAPDWFHPRFTAEVPFTSRDLRRRLAAGDTEDSRGTEIADVDDTEPQVRELTINRSVNRLTHKKLNAEIHLKAHRYRPNSQVRSGVEPCSDNTCPV